MSNSNSDATPHPDEPQKPAFLEGGKKRSKTSSCSAKKILAPILNKPKEEKKGEQQMVRDIGSEAGANYVDKRQISFKEVDIQGISFNTLIVLIPLHKSSEEINLLDGKLNHLPTGNLRDCKGFGIFK
eukprot:CAMPEP_0182494330 /NCGR_PEP_ID=MMETSP1321-20130603/3207_1 /TAXON_ID=91990 /ORGANISM="Bolidomonas sp., Strain RCC1657" /LENGTH=127 /DNA_ID=CAMNT_0024697379 /DNA_START=229 /DNA_END=609 /DNA_ORIENTATION=+